MRTLYNSVAVYHRADQEILVKIFQQLMRLSLLSLGTLLLSFLTEEAANDVVLSVPLLLDNDVKLQFTLLQSDLWHWRSMLNSFAEANSIEAVEKLGVHIQERLADLQYPDSLVYGNLKPQELTGNDAISVEEAVQTLTQAAAFHAAVTCKNESSSSTASSCIAAGLTDSSSKILYFYTSPAANAYFVPNIHVCFNATKLLLFFSYLQLNDMSFRSLTGTFL